jgi:hypothetical protein
MVAFFMLLSDVFFHNQLTIYIIFYFTLNWLERLSKPHIPSPLTYVMTISKAYS